MESYLFFVAIGKTALFEPVPSSVGFPFEFHNVNFFTEQGHQPCVQTRTCGTSSLYLCPPVTGGDILTHCLVGNLFFQDTDNPKIISRLKGTIFLVTKQSNEQRI